MIPERWKEFILTGVVVGMVLAGLGFAVQGLNNQFADVKADIAQVESRLESRVEAVQLEVKADIARAEARIESRLTRIEELLMRPHVRKAHKILKQVGWPKEVCRRCDPRLIHEIFILD